MTIWAGGCRAVFHALRREPDHRAISLAARPPALLHFAADQAWASNCRQAVRVCVPGGVFDGTIECGVTAAGE